MSQHIIHDQYTVRNANVVPVSGNDVLANHTPDIPDYEYDPKYGVLMGERDMENQEQLYSQLAQQKYHSEQFSEYNDPDNYSRSQIMDTYYPPRTEYDYYTPEEEAQYNDFLKQKNDNFQKLRINTLPTRSDLTETISEKISRYNDELRTGLLGPNGPDLSYSQDKASSYAPLFAYPNSAQRNEHFDLGGNITQTTIPHEQPTWESWNINWGR